MSDRNKLSIEEVVQQHILAVLDSTGWHKSKAAKILGCQRSTLDRKLTGYGVTRQRCRLSKEQPND